MGEDLGGRRFCSHEHGQMSGHCDVQEGEINSAKKRSFFRALVRFFGWWLAFFGLYSAFSVCPFCGQTSCPVGIGSAGVLGGIFALLIQGYNRVAIFIRGVFNSCKRLLQKRLL